MSRWITIEAAELAVKALEEENARLKAEMVVLSNCVASVESGMDLAPPHKRNAAERVGNIYKELTK